MKRTGRPNPFCKPCWIAAIAIASSLGYSGAAGRAPGPPTTLLIVRHADRDGDKDALSAAGAARARELVHVASRAGIAAIYCSKTARSRKTAEPLALALGLTPVELEPNDIEGLTTRVFKDHRGRTVLVVAHSNTVAKIIASAGGPGVKDLSEDDFDDLFVLNVGSEASSQAGLVNLQYGAATP